MAERSLHGCRILVVEDEYLLADDLSQVLAATGAEVLGPVPSIEAAMRSIASEPVIDAAILDVHLRGEFIFPVADDLAARGIPFAFATGYDQWAMPDRFRDRPRLEKPLQGPKIADALGLMLDPAGRSR